MDFDSINMDFAGQLQLLAPFGNGNPKPVFRLENVALADVKYMGSENQHARFTAWDYEGRSLQCVLFNKAQEYGISLFARRTVDLIGTLDCQIWQGQQRLQFITEKIKFD